MKTDKTSLMDGAALERFRDEAKRLMRQKKSGTIDGDTMLRLIAHIDALTAERDEYKKVAVDLDDLFVHSQKRIEELTAENERLRAGIKDAYDLFTTIDIYDDAEHMTEEFYEATEFLRTLQTKGGDGDD